MLRSSLPSPHLVNRSVRVELVLDDQANALIALPRLGGLLGLGLGWVRGRGGGSILDASGTFPAVLFYHASLAFTTGHTTLAFLNMEGRGGWSKGLTRVMTRKVKNVFLTHTHLTPFAHIALLSCLSRRILILNL